MGVVIGMAITIFALAVVAWPLIRGTTRDSGEAARGEALTDLRRARSDLYRLMSQLEQDREAGIIGAGEYSDAHKELRLQAAGLLRREKEAGSSGFSRETLEEEIESFRSQEGTVRRNAG